MAWNVGDGRGGIKTVADFDASNLADVQAVYDRGRKGVATSAAFDPDRYDTHRPAM